MYNNSWKKKPYQKKPYQKKSERPDGLFDVHDPDFMAFVVSRYIPLAKVLAEAGYEGYGYNKPVFCPFHANEVTESARITHGKAGDSLWCSAENRMYRSADVFIRGMVAASLESAFDALWRQFDETGKCQLIDAWKKSEAEGAKRREEQEIDWEKHDPALSRFKAGYWTIDQMMSYIIRLCEQGPMDEPDCMGALRGEDEEMP